MTGTCPQLAGVFIDAAGDVAFLLPGQETCQHTDPAVQSLLAAWHVAAWQQQQILYQLHAMWNV